MFKVINHSNTNIKIEKIFTYLMIIIPMIPLIIIGDFSGSFIGAITILQFAILYLNLSSNAYILFNKRTKLHIHANEFSLEKGKDKIKIKKNMISHLEFSFESRSIFFKIILKNGIDYVLEDAEYFYLLKITDILPKFFLVKLLLNLKNCKYGDFITLNSKQLIKNRYEILIT